STDSYATALAAGAPNGYQYVSVTVVNPLAMYFLPALAAFNGSWSISQTYNISALAVAGQQGSATGATNMVPLSPDSQAPGATNFGFAIGQQYTLKWGNNNT